MTVKTKKTIMLVCAEKSGDLLGANLIESLKVELKDYELDFIGVGGSAMQKAGLKTIFPMEDIAVMGLFEVIPHLKIIFKRIKQTVATALDKKVDMLVTIDGAEFAFKVAKGVKKENKEIPIVHYVSPQVWAWRQNRVYKMEKFLDHVLALFPFEEDFYKKTNLKCTYVGHPIVERFTDLMPKTTKKTLNKTLKVAILPGSRKNELAHLLPVLGQTVVLLKQRFKNIKFILPVAEGFDKENFDRFFSQCEYVSGDDKFEKLKSCDAAITCSGTANLELAMLGLPMVVCYKMNNLTYQIAKRVVKVKHISPVNIVADKKVAKEFIQEECTAKALVRNVSPLLKDTKQRQKALEELKVVREKLAIQEESASIKAAKVVASYIK
jgi:lipid-A-disaccharide synthase